MIPSDKDLLEFAIEEEFMLFCDQESVLDIMKTTLQKFSQPKEYFAVSQIDQDQILVSGPEYSLYATITRKISKKHKSENERTMTRMHMREIYLAAELGDEVFAYGDRVRKKKGSEWVGRVVGFYSTELNPNGYVVESEAHRGSAQIYPGKALYKTSED